MVLNKNERSVILYIRATATDMFASGAYLPRLKG